MRARKVQQLNKINTKIIDLQTELDCLEHNGEAEWKIKKTSNRLDSTIERGYKCAKTMTQEEYDASYFGDTMCIDYNEAIID